MRCFACWNGEGTAAEQAPWPRASGARHGFGGSSRRLDSRPALREGPVLDVAMLRLRVLRTGLPPLTATVLLAIGLASWLGRAPETRPPCPSPCSRHPYRASSSRKRSPSPTPRPSGRRLRPCPPPSGTHRRVAVRAARRVSRSTMQLMTGVPSCSTGELRSRRSQEPCSSLEP
jgi:hypothetical protein